MKPALTAEEWAEEFANNSDPSWDMAARIAFAVNEGSQLHPITPHGLAALALYGQPFGFTWDMVRAINMFTTPYAGDPLQGMSDKERMDYVNKWRVIAQEAADLIEALLPPEK